MSEDLKNKKVRAVHEAIERVRDGRIERSALRNEGPRTYSESLPRVSIAPAKPAKAS